MVHITKIGMALCTVAFVAACSQPEPEPIPITPIYDKVGTPSCPAGTILAVDAATGGDICVVPEAV